MRKKNIKIQKMRQPDMVSHAPSKTETQARLPRPEWRQTCFAVPWNSLTRCGYTSCIWKLAG